MKLKRLFLAVMCVMLICAISVTGTLAYLSAQTNAVTNTFVAASGLVTELTLDESKATLDSETGLYTLDTATRVSSNNYTVLPGTTLEKDPTVHLIGKTATPAFLYIEVVDNTSGAISCTIDPDLWKVLADAIAPHGGKVYQYIGPALNVGNSNVGIIKDNIVTVQDSNALESLGTDGKTIQFYAYIAQATMDAATEPGPIFNVCFS